MKYVKPKRQYWLHCGCCNCDSPNFTIVYVASFCGNQLKLFCIHLSLGVPFTVNETTGDIETTGNLDRETNSSFTLVIIVRIHHKFLSLQLQGLSIVRKKKKNKYSLLFFSSLLFSSLLFSSLLFSSLLFSSLLFSSLLFSSLLFSSLLFSSLLFYSLVNSLLLCS